MRVFTNTAIVAKNPFVVLGTGGAYRHIRHLATPAERRGRLGFFDQPFVYLPMLLIVVLVHLKGYVPTVVKKIPDALGQLIHLVSGAPGLLFVMVEVFDTPAGSGNSGVAHLIEGFYIVVCAFVYLVIWAAFSVVEAAITLSPFGFVDPVLKHSRNLLLVTISAMSEIHPVLGFLAAFCVFLVCLWLVHFSIRCTVISLVYSFGLLGRMFGFAPAGNETIWAFSCWGLRGVPLWSRGRIRRRKTGPVFVYKRLFLVWERIVPLPEEMSVAVGTINPFLRSAVDGQKKLLLRFSPIYRRHEEDLRERLGLNWVVDISLQTTVKRFIRSIWDGITGAIRWIWEKLTGRKRVPVPAGVREGDSQEPPVYARRIAKRRPR